MHDGEGSGYKVPLTPRLSSDSDTGISPEVRTSILLRHRHNKHDYTCRSGRLCCIFYHGFKTVCTERNRAHSSSTIKKKRKSSKSPKLPTKVNQAQSSARICEAQSVSLLRTLLVCLVLSQLSESSKNETIK